MMSMIASAMLISASGHCHVEGQRFALVERVAEEVADLLLEKFNSPWVRIKVSKPGAVARAANVGVIIERGNNLKGINVIIAKPF
jgi:dihydroneopterin aldolase